MHALKYPEINFVCERFLELYSPEDCLSNMKLRTVNY